MVEGLSGLLRTTSLSTQDVSRLTLRVAPRWLTVCDKRSPRTGLEVKFSYAWLAGMTVTGLDTSSDKTFADTLCTDPTLANFAECVDVVGDPSVGDMVTHGLLETTDGRQFAFSHDLAAPMDRSALRSGLRAKASNLVGKGSAETIWSAIQKLESTSARSLAATLLAPPHE